MRVRVGCSMVYESSHPTPMLLTIVPRQHDIGRVRFEDDIAVPRKLIPHEIGDGAVECLTDAVSVGIIHVSQCVSRRGNVGEPIPRIIAVG